MNRLKGLLRQTPTVVCRACAIASALLLASCSSYRICGFNQIEFNSRQSDDSLGYRIVRLKLGLLTGDVDGLQVFGQAAACSEQELIRGIRLARPDVFTDNPAAFPIDVEVSMTSSSQGGRATKLLFLLSLGTLPLCENFYSEGVVSVVPSGAKVSDKTEQTWMRFVTNRKFTLFSPFGWISYPNRPDASVVEKASHRRSPASDELLNVFFRTAANAIAAAAADIDRSVGVPRPGKAPAARPPAPAKSRPKKPAPNACRICGALLGVGAKCPLCE